MHFCFMLPCFNLPFPIIFVVTCPPCQLWNVSFWLLCHRRWFRELKFFRHLSEFLIFWLTGTDHPFCTSFHKRILSVFRWCSQREMILNKVLPMNPYYHQIVGLGFPTPSSFLLLPLIFQTTTQLVCRSRRRNFGIQGQYTWLSFWL